jgi:hypothetical protein
MNLFRSPLTVKSYANGAYIDGEWQEGAETQFTIQGSVQPASGEEMQLLPEGRRKYGAYRVYTNATLKTANEDANNPDKVVLFDREHEVVAEMNWRNNVITHNKYLCARLESK